MFEGLLNFNFDITRKFFVVEGLLIPFLVFNAMEMYIFH